MVRRLVIYHSPNELDDMVRCLVIYHSPSGLYPMLQCLVRYHSPSGLYVMVRCWVLLISCQLLVAMHMFYIHLSSELFFTREKSDNNYDDLAPTDNIYIATLLEL